MLRGAFSSHIWIVFLAACLILSGCEDESSTERVQEETERETDDSPAIQEVSTQEDDEEQPPREVLDPVEESTSLEENLCEPSMEGGPTWYSDVERIFFENCVICHADTPIYGAPMSLVSFSDSVGQSFSSPDVTMLEMIAARVADGTMPPASQPAMPLSDRELLDRWIAECGPEGDEEERDDAIPVKAQVPPPPVGATVMEFSAAEFEVPLKDDHYMCFPFQISLDKPQDIIRFDYFLDEVEVIHHIVLYGDPNGEGGTEPFECGGIAVDHSEFMYAWAPGGQPLHFPEGYGFPVKDGERVILQVHYNNVKKLENLKDSTGVRFFLEDPQDEEVGMTAIGPLKIQVPPFSESTSESACFIEKETTILTSSPHMHETGKAFRQVVIREDGTEELIVELTSWDFNEQYGFHTPVTLYPGDKLVTRCDFENPHAYTVVQGDDTNNEMCFNFMYLYPPMESSFCDDPLNLEELTEVDKEPGICGEELPMGEVVSGGIMVGEVETEEAYLNTLPEGDWVMTDFSAVLPENLVSDYQLDLEGSKSFAQASMRSEAIDGDQQGFVLDLDLSLTLSVGLGGTFPIQSAYSFGGFISAAEGTSSDGMSHSETTCEAGAISLSQVRMLQVDNRLEGYLTFDASFGTLAKVDYFLVLERVSDPEQD